MLIEGFVVGRRFGSRYLRSFVILVFICFVGSLLFAQEYRKPATDSDTGVSSCTGFSGSYQNLGSMANAHDGSSPSTATTSTIYVSGQPGSGYTQGATLFGCRDFTSVPAGSTYGAVLLTLTGSYSFNGSTPNAGGTVVLQYSTNSGSSWSTLFSGGGMSGTTNGPWSVSLPNAQNPTQVKLRLKVSANGGTPNAHVGAGNVSVSISDMYITGYPAIPAAPSNLIATPASNGLSVALSWTDNSTTESNFVMERCTGSACSTFTVLKSDIAANVVSYTDSTVTTGTTFRYRVKATNFSGGSGYATTSDVITPAAPSAPTNVVAVAGTNGTTSIVTWTDVANETSYNVERCMGDSCSSGFNVVGSSLPADTRSFPDSGLTPGAQYGYRVQAFNAAGASPYSNISYMVLAGSSNVHYYISDHLGSTALVTDSVGVVQQEVMYFPYGGERWSSGTDSNHYKFSGKERDSESASLDAPDGLDYFGARYYSSNMGRFMSADEFTGGPVDTFGGAATALGPLPYADIVDPQSLNKYAYALNNPLRFIDPDGHDPQCPSCKTEYDNETKQGGTKNWRNNNPGNIVYGDFAKAHGAIGKDKDGFAIFPDAKSGKDAQNNLWESKSYQERSITDATKRWTSGDPAEIQRKYAEDIAKAAGVSPDTKIKDLTPEQRQKLQDAQRKREGYQEGKVIPKKAPAPKKKEEQK